MAKAKGARPVRTVRTQPPRAATSATGTTATATGTAGAPKRSWLDGPPPRTDGFAGDRLGYPQRGRGSMATQGAKLGAFLIDIVVAEVVAFVALRPHSVEQLRLSNIVSDVVFVLGTAALLALSGQTIGMRLLHLQVVRLDGRTMGWRSLPRQVLVGLLIPALIVNRDRRALYDQWLRTAVVNTR